VKATDAEDAKAMPVPVTREKKCMYKNEKCGTKHARENSSKRWRKRLSNPRTNQEGQPHNKRAKNDPNISITEWRGINRKWSRIIGKREKMNTL
jgi:hypothetical protein